MSFKEELLIELQKYLPKNYTATVANQTAAVISLLIREYGADWEYRLRMLPPSSEAAITDSLVVAKSWRK